MPSLDTLLQFFGLTVLLALSPGPDNLFVLMQSIQHGWRTGLLVVLGLCLGVCLHTLAVAMGLAALLAASPQLLTLLKLLGAAYLLWLAWGAWHAPVAARTPDAAPQAPQAPQIAQRPNLRQALRRIGRGLVMNLSNPKVLLFFLAFLPQFAHPARGPVAAQVVVLGAVFALSTLLVFGSIAFFSGSFGQALQRSARMQRVLNRSASIVFAALALRLLIAQVQ
ncbi:threonine transporter RhtB [Vandammella animalimorsus]|uniref:Threonine transporter RhtB n=1 Tax=Vandammella animalimorsus TaxID=2029117 RepID=A0A2A2T4S6_9BURK|nr:LysE family translocator [Vandammella animalimorsus]PAT30736.1 threonine transporter RhtB [Vandammella animalimorsus]PAX16564.1 threonine transporter RhtB [Vandammella animalimorsus]PAX19194.1 threonine transporter RhtB [Vandammella animalimorsus]